MNKGYFCLVPVMLAAGSVFAQDITPAQSTDTVVISPTQVDEIKTQPQEITVQAAKWDAMKAEWEFFKSFEKENDEDTLAAALPQIVDWLRNYPDSGYADKALLLKAAIYSKLGQERYSIVALLKCIHQYPDSSLTVTAVKMLKASIEKACGKDERLTLDKVSVPIALPRIEERLAAFNINLAELDGDKFYEPLLEEFSAFFSRFPDYSKRDAIQLALGNLHLKKEEFIKARVAYEKLIKMYPESALQVKAKKALADVLAIHLKDYDSAINVYQEVASVYPGTEEAWLSYGQLAKLTEKRKKYALAAEVYEKIIALYPEKEAAYESYKAEARVLRDELSKPKEAIAVLGRLADKYKGEQAIEALYLAAKIARKDLKDLVLEVAMLDRISAEYPENIQAPKALFAAAQAYEDAGKFNEAKNYYSKIAEKYPADPLAAKAQKKILAIIQKAAV